MVFLNKNYTIFHCHTDLSSGVTNIDSITKYYDYIDKVKQFNMKAFAISEHGSIFEWVHKKNMMDKNEIKYIHAQEFYITKTLDEKIRDNYHCILIAKNYNGVEELNTLSSIAFNRDDNHYYYVPRISYDELKSTSENIIISTACLGGILNSNDDELENDFINFLSKNKNRCFLEIQHHICEQQKEFNKKLYDISQKYNIKLITGTDTHALNEEHRDARVMLQKGKKIHFDSEDEFDLVFKTYDELVKCYEVQDSLPKDVYLNAIENTNLMADMIESFELNYDVKYPKLYENSEAVFDEKIKKGFIEKGIDKLPNKNEYLERIEYEKNVYNHNKAIDFMLLEEDYKTEMRKKNIYCGYSRGSVSGSLIAYLLGITYIDSLKFNMNFERFMNSERVSLADIDSDWYSEDRDKVREYLYNKKGLYCCDIITFNTIALKGAIKDIGRALNMSIQETQELSDAVYEDEKKQQCIDEKYIKKYPELFHYANLVKGVIVSVGNHPSALVVSPIDVNNAFATMSTSKNANPISQINMKEIDSLNFVKLDVLGLDSIGLINKTCELANIPRLEPDNIDFDDEKVWDSIRDDTTSIFQWESGSATQYVRKLLSKETILKIKSKNENFSYLDVFSMGNGAIRPAGASYRDEMSNGIYKDNGHPALNEFFAPTLGYMVYQESLMEFLHKFCGYTMGEADIVRRGFAKKTGTEKFIPKIKAGFIETMKKDYDVSENNSEKLIVDFIKVIEDSSDYLFSLNHSLSYSMIGYAIAWLRYYYPLEFVAASLNIWKGDEEKTANIIKFSQNNNIIISAPKFRHSKSEYQFDKENGVIYKGLESIKYLSKKCADGLYSLKDNKYNTFIELLSDITTLEMDSRQLDILIKLDFFSEFGNVKKLLTTVNIFNFLKCGSMKQISADKLDGLEYLKDIIVRNGELTESGKTYRNLNMPQILIECDRYICSQPIQEVPLKSKISWQQEYLGYISFQTNNPKDRYKLLVIDAKPLYTRDKSKIYSYVLKCMSFFNGKTQELKVWERYFKKFPLQQYDVIFTEKNSFTREQYNGISSWRLESYKKEVL